MHIRNNADPDLTFYFDADPDLDKIAKYSLDFMTNSFFSLCTVLWIRIGFNADLDKTVYFSADPDPGQTLPSLKVQFLHVKCKVTYLM
jgi:hypothetical protein